LFHPRLSGEVVDHSFPVSGGKYGTSGTGAGFGLFFVQENNANSNRGYRDNLGIRVFLQDRDKIDFMPSIAYEM